jgi:hypothetical protein
MHFEKKVAVPPERAMMLRAAAATSNPNSNKLTTLRIVKDALAE